MKRLASLLMRHQPAAWIVALILSVIGGWAASEWARRHLEAKFRQALEVATTREDLLLRGATEDSRAMGALRFAARFNEELRAAARVEDVDVARRTRPAEAVLAAIVDHAGGDMAYVVNRHGVMVAEWNRGVQVSPIGLDFSRHSYFDLYLSGRLKVFLAMSISSSRRSLYLSTPIPDPAAPGAAPLGLLSVRLPADTLDRFLGVHADMEGLLISPQGVVMAASEPAWVMTLVGPPSSWRMGALLTDSRYGRFFEDPARRASLPFDPGASTTEIAGRRHAVSMRELRWGDAALPWRLVFVSDLNQALSPAAARGIAAATALILFLLQAALLRQLASRATRRTLEARQQAQSRRYLTILEHAPAGIGVVADGVVTLANPALRQLVNARPGGPWPDAFADETSRERAASLLAQGASAADVELRVVDPHGARRACLATFQRMTFGASATVVWLTDLSDELAAEEDIRGAMAAAESATRNKADFLANMSHELRTPLNAIIGMSDLALRTELAPRQRNYVEKAHRAAGHLLQVIDDILDFSRIEAGKLSLERIPFQLETPLEHLVQVIGLALEEKGVELLLNVPARVPTALVGDPLRLGQVLAHLGRHAAQVTQHGAVVVGVSLAVDDGVERTPSTVTLQFSVRDSGPGFAPADLARMRRQLRDGGEDAPDGSGLALTVCRQLVDMMGGRLWVESMPGVCAIFHFTARLALGDPTLMAEPLPPLVQGERRVLIVDDSHIARELLATLCRDQGLLPQTIDSGDAALSLALSAERLHQPFDLVLMDWKMPGMDGLSATMQLRAALIRPPRVIMVTAFGNDDTLYEAMARLLPAERPPVLAKPVTAATLRGALAASASLPASARAQRRHAATEAMRSLAGARVLVVEDNEVNQELTKDLLEQAGVTVTLASNGGAALAWLASAPEGIDGVLMDCQMPEMDGFDTTRRLREDPRWERLPVIALTAHATGEDRDRILAAGMDDHIAKPFKPDLLFETLARWLRPGGPKPGMASSETPAPAPSADNAAMHARLLRIFHQSQQDTLVRIDQATDREDWAMLGRIAHSLRGSTGAIGAWSLGQAAAALEQACLDDRLQMDTDGRRRELAAQLSAGLDRLLSALGETIAAQPDSALRHPEQTADGLREALERAHQAQPGEPERSS